MKIDNHLQERVKFWGAIYEATPTQTGLAVPSTVSQSIADALKTYSAMRRVCTVITSTTGGTLMWPNSDGRGEIGEQLEQNTQSTSLDPNFGATPIHTFKYSSKLIRVPIELWQDAGADFATFMDNRIASRIGRITNRKLTIGTGTAVVTDPTFGQEPIGIVGAAGLGKIGPTGQVLTVTDDDLEDLVYSVDEAYRLSLSCGWMMHEQTLRSIKKLKDPAGRPLKLVERGADLVERLKGYPVTINNDMPVMAANAKSILFGDFSAYVVRDVLGLDVRRLTDSALTLVGQIGLIGFTRTGGAYVDVGGAIKAYQNAAS